MEAGGSQAGAVSSTAGLGTTLRVAKRWKRLVGEGVRVREGSRAGWPDVVSRRPGPKVTACQSQKRI